MLTNLGLKVRTIRGAIDCVICDDQGCFIATKTAFLNCFTSPKPMKAIVVNGVKQFKIEKLEKDNNSMSKTHA